MQIGDTEIHTMININGIAFFKIRGVVKRISPDAGSSLVWRWIGVNPDTWLPKVCEENSHHSLFQDANFVNKICKWMKENPNALTV